MGKINCQNSPVCELCSAFFDKKVVCNLPGSNRVPLDKHVFVSEQKQVGNTC